MSTWNIALVPQRGYRDEVVALSGKELPRSEGFKYLALMESSNRVLSGHNVHLDFKG